MKSSTAWLDSGLHYVWKEMEYHADRADIPKHYLHLASYATDMAHFIEKKKEKVVSK